MKQTRWLMTIVCVVMITTTCTAANVNRVETKEFSWQPFIWSPWKSGDIQYDKAAIMVPIQFEGSERKFWLQLDTGATSQLRGITFESIAIPHEVVQRGQGYNVVRFNAKIAGYDTQNAVFASMNGQGASLDNATDNVRIGTLGMDFFKDKILVLDFPNDRLAITSAEAQVPSELIGKAHFYKAEMLRHFFVIHPSVGITDIRIAYDTGSSLFPLITDKDLWQKITGRQGDEEDSARVESLSWGSPVTLIGAPTKEDMHLSDFALGRPIVYYDEGRPDAFNGTGIDGVMGNSPFYSGHIVIIDPMEHRFGLVKTE